MYVCIYKYKYIHIAGASPLCLHRFRFYFFCQLQQVVLSTMWEIRHGRVCARLCRRYCDRRRVCAPLCRSSACPVASTE